MENYIKDFLSEPLTMRKEEVIYLFNADLSYTPINKEIKIDDVEYYSFRSSSITKETFCKASLVIYVSHKEKSYKILKSRHFKI